MTPEREAEIEAEFEQATTTVHRLLAVDGLMQASDLDDDPRCRAWGVRQLDGGRRYTVKFEFEDAEG